MSLAQIGALTWIPFLVLGLVKIDAGRWSDSLVSRGWAPARARMTMMLIAAAITPASWVASLAGTPGVAIALMSALMFAHGIWITNYMALIGDTVKKEEVATTVGLTGTCGGIAGMISSLVIGPVVDRYSFQPVFAVTAILYPLAWIALRARSGISYEDQRGSSVPA
jgi:ACS family hexuronate transporter-like MFS transporter